MKYRTLLILLVAVTVIAVNLTLLYTQSIRLDESQSIWVATKPIHALLRYVAQDVHTPGYFILLHFWTQIFGIDVSITRMLSLLFFVMTVPVVYKITRTYGDKKIALLTLLLFSSSPFLLWFTLETRMYTMLLFVTTLHTLLFLLMIDGGFKQKKLSFFITTVAGLYTHYFFLFFLAAQSIYIFLKHSKYALRYMALVMSAFLIFGAWITYVFTLGAAVNAAPVIPAPDSYAVFGSFINFLFGFQSVQVQTALIALWPLLVIILFFIFTRKNHISIRHKEYFFIMSFFPVFLTFLLSFFKPVFLPRYLIFITPSLFLLLAWFMLQVFRRSVSFVSCALIIMMIVSLIIQNTSAANPVREDYENVANFLNTYVTPFDIVAVSAPFTIYPVEYHYNGHARLTTIPEWNRYREGTIPAFSENTLRTQLKDYEDTYNRLIVVLSYDQGYEEKLLAYLETHYHRLEKRNFPSDIQVRVYRMKY